MSNGSTATAQTLLFKAADSTLSVNTCSSYGSVYFVFLIVYMSLLFFSSLHFLGNSLRFANGLLGNNVNYTTLSTEESQITLRLGSGSHWRMNFENLPGVLTLLAVNAGEGFVAVGPTNSGKGDIYSFK
jgi:hypothetical protein